MRPPNSDNRKPWARHCLALLLLALSMAVAPAVARAPQTDSGFRVKLEDVAGYRMWFRSHEGRDLTEAYAGDVLAGRFRPRADTDYWNFGFPIDWEADPFSEDNWQFLLHSFYMLDPLLVMEERTGQVKYAKGMLRILDDWYRYHVEEGQEAPYSWYNMAVGMRSAKIAYLHAMLKARHPELLDEAQERIFTRLANVHVEPVVSGEIPLRLTNHGLFQIHGVVALCREFPSAEACSRSAAYVSEWLPKIIDSQFDAEGIHLEHSPAYHRFTLAKLETLRDSSWYRDVPEIAAAIERAQANVFWLLDPDNRYWGVGDSIPSEQPGADRLALPQNSCSASLAESELPESECVAVKQFAAGYVVVKTLPRVPPASASGLFFQGAFPSSVHKHLDDQTFEWFEKGRRIIVDSGYFGYETSLMRRYMQSTRAHNTVEIGGRDFSRADKYAYGSAVKDVSRISDYVRIQGRVEHQSLSAVHSRQLIYRPGAWLLVRDWVSSSPSRSYRQWFHLAPDAKLMRRDEHSATFAVGSVELGMQSLSGCELSVARGSKDPVYQGWYSPSQRVAVPNYAVAFECEPDGKPTEVALTLGEASRDDLIERMDAIRSDNPFN